MTKKFGFTNNVMLNLFQHLSAGGDEGSPLTPTLSRRARGRRAAFTLAEVLITLAIIGVVATMTIPTLISDYQEKVTITRLNKTYSLLSNAFQLMQAEYGNINTWGLTNTSNVDPETGETVLDWSSANLISARMKKYLKVAKECSVSGDCYDRTFYLLSGNEYGRSNYSDVDFVLSDGTLVGFGYYNNTPNTMYGDIFVILPGKDDILGKTRFYFNYSTDGILQPEGHNNSNASKFNACDSKTTTGISGRGCTAWVIYNKNMDYLHCRDKLSWAGAHSCKDAD